MEDAEEQRRRTRQAFIATERDSNVPEFLEIGQGARILFFITFHLSMDLCHLLASAGWHPLHRQSRRGPGGQNKPASVEHLAILFRAHIPRYSPTPRLSGCAPRLSETKPVFDPNNGKRADRESVLVQPAKEP